MSEAATPELILDRFCGREIYPIITATWNLYRDERRGQMTFCVHIDAARGSKLHQDTESLDAEPWWELNVVEPDMSESSLSPGATFVLPKGYDDSRGGYLTNLYYCDHESSEGNSIEVLAVDANRLLLRVVGETIDVNFYDGSKPPTKLLAETWFTRDSKTMRSMA